MIAMVVCSIYFEYERGLPAQHLSPAGKEVILRDDDVSRPTMFYQDKIIWKYQGNAFMETVYFEITGVSENEILISEEIYDIKEAVFVP